MNVYRKLYDLDDKEKVIVIHIIDSIHGNNLIKPSTIAIIKFIKEILAQFGSKLVSVDDDIELIDISEEEIKQREAEEKRMQDKLSRLQLEKLLKKKVRAK